jgi:hypothetical protein
MRTHIQFGFNQIKSYKHGNILKQISMPSDGSHLRFLINAKTVHVIIYRYLMEVGAIIYTYLLAMRTIASISRREAEGNSWC